MSNRAIPRAKRSYRPLCSPRPWTTAKVMFAIGSSQARKASLVPSAELMEPCAATALSGAKVPEPSQDLERLLFRFEQRGRIGAHPAQRVRPLWTGWAHRVEPESWWIEE